MAEDRWPTFQALATAADDDAFAVIKIPYRGVPSRSDWEWTNDDLEIREFSADETWEDVLAASNDAETSFGPFFTIDRVMVAGSIGSWSPMPGRNSRLSGMDLRWVGVRPPVRRHVTQMLVQQCAP